MGVRGTWGVSLLVLFACSGASGSFGGGGRGDGGSTDDAAPSASDDGSGETDSSDDSESSIVLASAPWDATGAPCPDISGAYDQLSWNGVGCGSDNAVSTVCVVLAQQVCSFQLASAQLAPDAGTLTVGGVIDLQNDGSFSGGALQLGGVPRTGCTGQWDAPSQTLTIDCGAVDSGQGCVVTMTRTASAC